MAGKPFVEEPRRRMLQAALAYYQEFIRQRRDDPSIQKELQTSQARVQTLLSELTALIGAGRYLYLKFPEVQDELNLSAQQRESLAAIDHRWHEQLRELDQLGPSELERHRLAMAREQQTDVALLLTAAQYLRFRQIALQAEGPAAFREPEVLAALNLTAGQRERIGAIEASLSVEAGPHRQGRSGGPPGPVRQLWGRLSESTRKAAMQQTLAILTPPQRQQWERMIGAPFDVAMLGPPPGHFGPHHGHGGPPDWPGR